MSESRGYGIVLELALTAERVNISIQHARKICITSTVAKAKRMHLCLGTILQLAQESPVPVLENKQYTCTH